MPAAKPCPVCGEKAPCIDWVSAPYGMGVISFDEQYECGWHGVFALIEVPRERGGALGVWRGDSSRTVWRDCSPEEHEQHIVRRIAEGEREIEALQLLLASP